MLWNNETAMLATSGAANQSWQAQRVVIDSRSVRPGDLFVAIKGERFDGHQFAADALARGAVAAVVSKPLDAGASTLLVPDTLKALEDLGRAARARFSGRVVGVTGSVGKTSAKEMLRLALSAHGETYATSGNYNNHIGTPLNLANLPADAAFAVFEMGMNHAGEIAHLTRMARPHIALITTVEAVHLEFFESVDGICDAKAEIFEGVGEGGIAILNADNRYLNRLKMAAARQGISSVITFGESQEADVRLIAYQPKASGSEMDISVHGELVTAALGAIGGHWAKTALMTFAASHALKLDHAKTARALKQYAEPPGRGRLSAIALKSGEATLIDDSYNASPASMKSAFAKTQEVWEALGERGRKVAVLGDMLELGAQEIQFHVQLAEELQKYDFSVVHTSGARMKYLYDALPSSMRGEHVADPMQLEGLLVSRLAPGDVVLIKGSHGSHLYQLAERFLHASEVKHAV